MQVALAAPGLTDPDRFHLDFALGKAMHDAKRTAEAFSHYSAANALRLKSHPYNAGKLTKLVDRCIEVFTVEPFAERRGGCDEADPIFVVGLPRSGSTLIEQILSSHSLVEGTTELHDIAALSHDAGELSQGCAGA